YSISMISRAELIIIINLTPEDNTTQRIPFHKNLLVIENRRFLFRTHLESYSLTHLLCLYVNSTSFDSLCRD
ncbi:hypothetical protein VIGAN_01219000, partial [Vigna angularis var. angularis]